MTFSGKISLDPHLPSRRQICDYVRRAILSGELASGTKLPPTSTLASLWGTNVSTIQSSFSQLVKEGLLSRTPRRGTFVKPVEQRLRRVGIYIGQELALNPVARFSQEIVSCLASLMARFDVECTLLVDMRPIGEHGTSWERLDETIQRKELQGIIAITPDDVAKPWLEQLNLPVCYYTSLKRETDVSTNSRQFAELAVEYLYQHGCRKVALLLGYTSPALRDAFTDACDKFGLEVNPDHLVYPSGALGLTFLEHWGYEQFTKLMKRPNLPDGIVIYDDVIARGAVMGALAMQLDIPSELRVVIHRYAEIPFLCPVPASFVEFSCAELAAAGFEQLQRLFRGEPTKAISIPYRYSSR